MKTMDTKNWSIHVEFLVLFLTLIGGFYLLDGKIEKQGDRTDRLYEIYVTTQKDIYDLRADFNEKYYQLLGKEMK
jgi:hypothetical protein